MSEEDTEDEGKKKSPIVKMILIFLGLILVVGITVAATLFASGFFDADKEEDAEAALAELEAQAAEAVAARKKFSSIVQSCQNSNNPIMNWRKNSLAMLQTRARLCRHQWRL